MPLKHTVEEIILENGARGLIIDVPDATVVSYEVNFRAGNQYASDVSKQQTAHIMEHMVFGATKSLPSAEDFSREFTKNGAYYNATTYQRNMTYYAEAAYMEWDRILELQKMAICEPLFTEEILKTEKLNVREELSGQESNYYRLLWQRLFRDMGGTLLIDAEKKATIDAVTLEDIRNHHDQTHTTANMRFVLSGNLAKHRDQIVKAMEEWPLPRGEELPIVTENLRSIDPRLVFKKETPSSDVALHIVLNRRFTLDEMVAMARLNHILTGSFHSRMFGAARTRGLAYGLYSGTDTSIEDITRWEISGQVTVENSIELYKLIAEQLKKAADGDVSEAELNEAKQYGLGDYQFKGQTARNLSRWYASDYFEDLTIDPINAMPEHLEKVTVENMARLAKEFLEKGEWAIGAVGTITEDELNAVRQELSPIFSAEVK